MKSYTGFSRHYLIRKGFYNDGDSGFFLETLCPGEDGQMTEDQRLTLARDMLALYEEHDWTLCLESVLYSLGKATNIVLVKDEKGSLAGTLFAGRRSLADGTDLYYTERLIQRKDVPPNLKLLCAAMLLQTAPDFLKQPIRAVSITRRKVISQMLSVMGQDEIVSARDWPHLTEKQKEQIIEIARVSVGDYGRLESDLEEMRVDGVLRNIFTETFYHGGKNCALEGRAELSDRDAQLVMITIPGTLKQIEHCFNSNPRLNKYKIFRRFMADFTGGELWENIRPVEV